MNKRDFLKGLLGFATAVVALVGILKLLKPKPKPLTREMIITQALETAEGRAALAQAMVEPIRESLMYQSLSRKLLMTEEFPLGVLARYERDVAAKSHVVAKRINESIWRVG